MTQKSTVSMNEILSAPNTPAFHQFVSEDELLTPLEWDPEQYGIGVRSIDEQHKILIQLINELILAYKKIAHPSKCAPSPTGLQNTMLFAASTMVGGAAPGKSPRTGGGGGISPGPGRSLNSTTANASTRNTNHHPAASFKHNAGSPHVGTRSGIVDFEASLGATAGGGAAVGSPHGGMEEGKFSGPFPVVGNRQFDPRLQHDSPVGKLVEDLVTYTYKYLVAEDHVLETYAYVDRVFQQQDHELFASEVSFLFKMAQDHNVQLLDLRRMLVFLRIWTQEHIPRDRKYAPMLKIGRAHV